AALTITKSTVDIQINAPDATYDGHAHPAGVTISGLYPNVFPPDSVTYNGVPNNPVNAGPYTVVATFNGTSIYAAATATKTFAINKATPVVNVTGGTYTSDGQSHGASVTVLGAGGVDLGPGAMVTYNGSADKPINAGTYVAVATYDGEGNYGQGTGSAVVRILKATAVLTWNRPAGIVYG